jgi:hypothetical protein
LRENKTEEFVAQLLKERNAMDIYLGEKPRKTTTPKEKTTKNELDSNSGNNS